MHRADLQWQAHGIAGQGIAQNVQQYEKRTGNPMTVTPKANKAKAAMPYPGPGMTTSTSMEEASQAEALAQENHMLREQVQAAQQAAAEAMKRTEILAKEAVDQRAKIEMQEKVLTEAAVPKAVTPKAAAPSPAPAAKAASTSPDGSPLTVLTVATSESDEEGQESKKRTREAASKASGAVGTSIDVKHAQPLLFEHGTKVITANDNTQSKRNVVMPPLAKKLAVSVATIGAALSQPVHGLFSQIAGSPDFMAGSPDFMEIACAEDSALRSSMASLGYACKRVNYKQGYDLSKKSGTAMLHTELKMHPPKFAWVSLPCTRLFPLQNLTERSLEEWSNFEKRRGADLKRADEVAEGLSNVLDSNPDFDFGGYGFHSNENVLGTSLMLSALEWWRRHLPTVHLLWSPPLSRPSLKDGKMLNVIKEFPLTVTLSTTSLDLRRTSLDLWRKMHQLLNERPISGINLRCPEVLALTRNTFPAEPPTGRKLELIKQQMMRIHRASGHASFQNLQRLLFFVPEKRPHGALS
eukprot:s1130_g14.t1